MKMIKTSRFSVFAFTIVALGLVLRMEIIQVIHAQSTCLAPASNNQYWAPSTTMSVYIDPTFSDQEIKSINTALSNWFGQSALTGNNITKIPTTSDPGANAQNTIRILNNPSLSPSALSHTNPNVVTQNGASTGQMFNATIGFNRGFMLDVTTPAYDSTLPSAATFITKVFDHELGHVFGENDAPVPTNPNTGKPDVCLQAPGASVMNGGCGTNDTGGGGVSPTSVTSCDNTLVNKDITTLGGRTSTGTGGGHQRPCLVDGNGCPCDPDCTPVILDAEGNGFHLTSAEAGVMFDISGIGKPVQISWTDPRFHNAFLALPGPDGLVHNGKELFGNFTPQPPSDRPNGFIALAQYDKPENGGNGDGIIDEHDEVFSRLRLWIDENHDGICQPSELHRLPELGVYSLGFNYVESRRTDEFGNQFRYKAKVNTGERRDFRDERQHDANEVGRWAYDVFFVTK